MTEFRYPTILAESFRNEIKYRRYFWIIFVGPFLIAAFLCANTEDFFFSVICASSAIVVAGIFEFFLRKHMRQTLSLIETFLVYKDHSLILFDKNQKQVESIDTTKPFKVKYNYHVAGNAIYEVQQDTNKKITFSSRIDSAKYLVTQILGQKEWPPGDD